MLRTMIACGLVLCTLPTAQAESPFQEIKPGDGVFRIVDNECEINGDYVKRVSLTSNNGVLILYANKTADRVRPSVTVLLLDKYGLPIKRAEDKWLTYLRPQDSRSNTTYLSDVYISTLLRFTCVTLPDDAGTPMYLAVEE